MGKGNRMGSVRRIIKVEERGKGEVVEEEGDVGNQNQLIVRLCLARGLPPQSLFQPVLLLAQMKERVSRPHQ